VDDLAAAMDRLWTANRPKMLARGQAVLAALEDAAAGRPVDRTAAAREAHTLAGALGTYGRPGSALFAEIERVLDPHDDAAGCEPEGDLASCAERVRLALETLT
jgi:HPt (histidine-containing phosphotransfer) domain-containing protein